ncbi:hypothetical protein V496_00166 [Pseudogymnoascus sp. VKM F-4515 (FW-2607)]|nr:hypothetical protein V496_00166 [Pseudogymnoascus sp. VKM F-4515 (FW-2607)]
MLPSPSFFHLFPALPPEIRQQIWFESLPEARVLELKWNGEFWIGIRQGSHKPSGLLSVNMESRCCFLESYEEIELQIPTLDKEKTTKAVWHFNSIIDTLHLSELPPQPLLINFCLDALHSLENVRFLAVHYNDEEIWTLQNFTRFPGIKELRAITDDPLWNEHEGGVSWKNVELIGFPGGRF